MNPGRYTIHPVQKPDGSTGTVLKRNTPPDAVGDVNSTAIGSGARYNAGKPPYDLVPLTVVASSYGYWNINEDLHPALEALQLLGRWQETGLIAYLVDALNALGVDGGWDECAAAFDYGRRKYADWNWAKGMQWSIPLGCAARHLLAIIRRDHPNDLDPESGLPHRGHVFANITMLLTYTLTYPEGDDRPRLLERSNR